MLSDEQLDELWAGCALRGRVYARNVEKAVRNATLEEVAQMIDDNTEDDTCDPLCQEDWNWKHYWSTGIMLPHT